MHWLDIFLLVLLALAAFKGYHDGVVRQALSLLSWVISIALANRVVPYLAQHLDFLGEVQNVAWASWLLGFLICMTVCGIASHFLSKILDLALGILDNLLGMILGVMVAVLLLGLLLNVYGWLILVLGLPPIPDGLTIYPIIQSVMETFMNDYLFELIGGEKSTILQTV